MCVCPAFADKNGEIELYYEGQFIYDPVSQTLSFINNSVKYEINNQGITVKLPNQTVVLHAQPATIHGNLDAITQMDNVTIPKIQPNTH